MQRLVDLAPAPRPQLRAPLPSVPAIGGLMVLAIVLVGVLVFLVVAVAVVLGLGAILALVLTAGAGELRR